MRVALLWTIIFASLVTLMFTATNLNDVEACRAAAQRAGEAEWGTSGAALFPPGYRCSYVSGSERVPLDGDGWRTVLIEAAVQVWVLIGFLGFCFWAYRYVRRTSRGQPSAA